MSAASGALSWARRRSGRARRAWAIASPLVCALAAASPATAGAGEPARAARRASTPAASSFRRELDAALAHYDARRYAEARAAFLRALAVSPPNADRSSLEIDIAACDYELGAFREAEARFVRVAAADPEARSAALLHAGWAALGAGDDRGAQAHLDQVVAEPGLADERAELAKAVEAARASRDADELTREIDAAARAYEAGDRERASQLVQAARAHEQHGTPRSRAALAYLEALLARDRGDDDAARRALEESLLQDPGDASAQVLLAELALARGDRQDAERHYQASLAGDLSPRDAGSVRRALDALYGLPSSGLDAWATLGAGYDSNATLSGSGEALGYAAAADPGSPFAAPIWSVEQRWASGERSRVGAYYAGDWLLFSSAAAADASLMTHEAGVRFYLAPTATTELRLGAGAGPTFSGHALSPFSLDALLRARFAIRHGAHFRTHMLGELRPSLGLGEQTYLSGVRADVGAGERFQSGRWSGGLSAGWRYNGIGSWSLALAAPVAGCVFGCEDARYHIPLGYTGPLVDADADVELGASLQLGASLRYEHRTFLDDSEIQGDDVPAFVERLSRKTRVDDRYTLGGRARYRLGAAPELGAWLQYTLRLSRSNMASGSAGLDHAFDYDDRNYSQHVVEIGLDARY